MKKVFCTIFTPAYNRKDLMLRLYRSLCEQTVKNFEWVIVDDGSTDGTDEVFSSLVAEGFHLIYKKVENGGKHRAINHGLELANGKVFAIVDSDDFLTPDAIEKVEKHFAEIEKVDKFFAGIAVQKAFDSETAVGSTFEGEFVDATSLQRDKLNIKGDKFEIFYTDILKKFKFPEFSGERFMSEAVVWNRIAAAGYLLRWFNDKLYICDYLEGGLTDTRERAYENSPKGYLLYINELVQYNALSFKRKMGHYSLYRKIRRQHEPLKTTAKDLNVSVILLAIMYVIRVTLDGVRGLRKKNG